LIDHERRTIDALRQRLGGGVCTKGKRQGLPFTASTRIGLEGELARRCRRLEEALSQLHGPQAAKV